MLMLMVGEDVKKMCQKGISRDKEILWEHGNKGLLFEGKKGTKTPLGRRDVLTPRFDPPLLL